MVAIVVGYEALEAGLRNIPLEKVPWVRKFKRTVGGGVFEYESWSNIGVDVLLAVSGYALTVWTLALV